MADRITGYAPAPRREELDDRTELGAAARDFRDTLDTVNRARRVALDALMSHRQAAMRLTMARNAAEERPKPKPAAPAPVASAGPTPAALDWNEPEAPAPASLDDWN